MIGGICRSVTGRGSTVKRQNLHAHLHRLPTVATSTRTEPSFPVTQRPRVGDTVLETIGRLSHFLRVDVFVVRVDVFVVRVDVFVVRVDVFVVRVDVFGSGWHNRHPARSLSARGLSRHLSCSARTCRAPFRNDGRSSTFGFLLTNSGLNFTKSAILVECRLRMRQDWYVMLRWLRGIPKKNLCAVRSNFENKTVLHRPNRGT